MRPTQRLLAWHAGLARGAQLRVALVYDLQAGGSGAVGKPRQEQHSCTRSVPSLQRPCNAQHPIPPCAAAPDDTSCQSSRHMCRPVCTRRPAGSGRRRPVPLWGPPALAGPRPRRRRSEGAAFYVRSELGARLSRRVLADPAGIVAADGSARGAAAAGVEGAAAAAAAATPPRQEVPARGPCILASAQRSIHHNSRSSETGRRVLSPGAGLELVCLLGCGALALCVGSLTSGVRGTREVQRDAESTGQTLAGSAHLTEDDLDWAAQLPFRLRVGHERLSPKPQLWHHKSMTSSANVPVPGCVVARLARGLLHRRR